VCGIAGVLDLRTRVAEPALAQGMLDRLAHRGPDDEGRVNLGPLAFGMRRLSILDPSPRGHQPMASPDGRRWLVHNGEIYNFLELADELGRLGHRFESAGDTEVILAAYAEWGIDCVTRFNGIWAFALWDADRGRLILSRDRFGVKPLFVARGDGRIAFASEIKALLSLPWVTADPEPAAIHDFLLDGLVDHAPQTFFRGIEHVAAAHTLVVSAEGEQLRRYWGPPELAGDAFSGPAPGDEARVEEIRALLVDSVALQLRTDVPIGSCLSGGIDSSSIVAVASALRQGGLVPTWASRRDRDGAAHMAFFAEFREPGLDERRFVDAVIESTGTTLLTTSPSANAALQSLDAVVRAQDEPFGSTSIVAQYFVMERAHRSSIKVLLDGQGADEILAGYGQYRAMRVAGALRSGDLASRRAAMRALVARQVHLLPTAGHLVLGGRRVPGPLRRDRMPRELLGLVVRRTGSLNPALDVPPGTVLARNLWRQVASENLPALLRYEDRNSMAFGIEARVPFLDHRLVEASLLLPDRLKIAGREQKIALRRAMVGIVPQAVLDRRDKVAFQAPQRRWLLDPAFEARFQGRRRAESTGLLATGTIPRLFDLCRRGRVSDTLLWRAICVELWLDALGHD